MNVGCNNRMHKCNKVQINHDGPEASVEFGNGVWVLSGNFSDIVCEDPDGPASASSSLIEA